LADFIFEPLIFIYFDFGMNREQELPSANSHYGPSVLNVAIDFSDTMF